MWGYCVDDIHLVYMWNDAAVLLQLLQVMDQEVADSNRPAHSCNHRETPFYFIAYCRLWLHFAPLSC